MNKETSLVQKVQAFLNLEADLLDHKNLDQWLDLFEDDGIYWVPASPNQEDMRGEISIILEDKPLLQLRITRLSHPRAHATIPPPATSHLLGNVSITRMGDLIQAKSKLIVTEFRNEKNTLLSGSVTHELRELDSGFRIRLKRVDLAQAGGIFSAITIPL